MDRRRFIGTTLATATAITTGAVSAPLATAATPPRHPRRARPLFLGTYTSQPGGGTGIGLATYDEESGRVTRTGTLAGVPDPSYLALHPSGRTLYCVNERQQGGVTAIALSPDGAHRVLGTRDTGGAGPCHVSVHPSGRWLLSANYTSGSVAVHPVEASGALGERTDLVRHSTPPPGPGQEGPHAHQIVTTPDGRHILAVDLGTDTVYTYRLDPKAGRLRPVSYAALRPGAGPRHLTFHPSGRHAYLANEVDNTLARYAVEASGARLRLLDTVPVSGDFPRHLALSPSQRLLFTANQRSGSVSVFHVDGDTGELTLTGEPFAAPVAVCVLPL